MNITAKKTRQLVRREARRAYESEYYKAAHDYARRLIYVSFFAALCFAWALAATWAALSK